MVNELHCENDPFYGSKADLAYPTKISRMFDTLVNGGQIKNIFCDCTHAQFHFSGLRTTVEVELVTILACD